MPNTFSRNHRASETGSVETHSVNSAEELFICVRLFVCRITQKTTELIPMQYFGDVELEPIKNPENVFAPSRNFFPTFFNILEVKLICVSECVSDSVEV